VKLENSRMPARSASPVRYSVPPVMEMVPVELSGACRVPGPRRLPPLKISQDEPMIFAPLLSWRVAVGLIEISLVPDRVSVEASP
jgi:hypothetical protein